MIRRAALSVALALTLSGAVVAQEPPAARPAPDPQSSISAARPAPRPAGGGTAAPESQGALIPPGDTAETAARTPNPLPPPPRESDFGHAACLLALSILGARYEAVAPVSEPAQPGCGIARPIRLIEVQPGVVLAGGAVMRCATARALALWSRDAVLPAAARLPGAPRLVAMQPGSTYQCRTRVGDGDRPAKLSEHATGDAIDIAGFAFAEGPAITVQPAAEGGDMTLAFQRAVHGAACLYFTTVLGPGSNAAHDDHLHLDLARRRGGWRLCQ